jgi:hypothetical protein
MSESFTRPLTGLQAVLVIVVRLQYRVARLEGRTHDEARAEALGVAQLVIEADATQNIAALENIVDDAISLLYDAPERGIN